MTVKYTKDQIARVAKTIKNGGMVAFPTDTVYGLAIAVDDFSAIEKMKKAKGRPENKPFPMMVSSFEQLESVAIVNEKQKKVIDCFMPGALTIIFNKQSSLSDVVTNGFPTVGIRMPDDEWVLELIKMVGCPLLVPSANLSGAPACYDHNEVLDQLNGRIDGVVVGKSGALRASTIVDMSTDEIKLIRQGIITLAEIEEVIK